MTGDSRSSSEFSGQLQRELVVGHSLCLVSTSKWKSSRTPAHRATALPPNPDGAGHGTTTNGAPGAVTAATHIPNCEFFLTREKRTCSIGILSFFFFFLV